MWLAQKGFNPKSVDGDLYGYDASGEEPRWCLLAVHPSTTGAGGDILPALIVFESWPLHNYLLDSRLTDEVGWEVFDIRKPDSLRRLEAKIRRFVANCEIEEEEVIGDFRSEIEGLSDSELCIKVQDLDEFERHDDILGCNIPEGALRDRLEDELRSICAAELECRNVS